MLLLEPSLMSNMQTDHLLSNLHSEPLVLRTPVELELMSRLDKAQDKLKLVEGFDELIDDYELKVDQLGRLLESPHKANFDQITDILQLLHDADIETAEDLKTVLIQADLIKEL